jgi:hypothetical protein
LSRIQVSVLSICIELASQHLFCLTVYMLHVFLCAK